MSVTLERQQPDWIDLIFGIGLLFWVGFSQAAGLYVLIRIAALLLR